MAHTKLAMNGKNKSTKKAAGGQTKASKQYKVSNGTDSKIVNDPSNARKMAKRMNAKAKPGDPVYTVTPVAAAPAPVTVAVLQAAVDTASKKIAATAPVKSVFARAAIMAVIAVKGKELVLMKKGSPVVYAKRTNKPGAVAKLMRRAESPRPIGYGLKVENAAQAAKLEAAPAKG